MQLCKMQIGGRSVSGFATGITLPHMGILLDCGQANAQARQCPMVLLTHAHLDHFGGIIRHAYIRYMTKMSPSIFVVPDHMVEMVHEQFRFWAKAQKTRVIDYKVLVAKPGEILRLDKQKYIRSFRTIHRIPSQGYVIGETRKKLKSEYQGLEGPELGALRSKGVQVHKTVDVPLIAFTGDTQASVFDTLGAKEALQAKVLITECTFIDEEVSLKEAHRKGHVHLDELVSREGLFQNEAILLAHFSHRYGNKDVERAIEKMPPKMRAKTHYLPVN